MFIFIFMLYICDIFSTYYVCDISMAEQVLNKKKFCSESQK